MPENIAYDPATDPATLSGARNDPNYIGPTNFSNLQKQYTPYQIEQATERKGADIFWKQGVNIADIPTIAPPANLQPPVEKPPIPSDVMGSAIPTLTAPTSGSAEFDARNRAAATYLQGMQATIDDIQKQQEARLAQQKQEQQGVVKGLKDKLAELMNGTDYQDSLKKDRELFQVEQQIRDLGEIRTRIADAQNALTQGLIFEEGRATRMELLVGRSAELKKQGLAHIQALQSTAEIIKGNIDLARAYADDSIGAIRMDNEKRIGALNTLLSLEQSELISITEDEKQTIKERMNRLKEEADRISSEKDKVFALATENPQAFSKGGVTFMDTLDQAITKMLPHLSEEQKLALERKRLENELIISQISENRAQTTKALSGGSGGGATGGASGGVTSEIAAFIAHLRAKGLDEQSIREEVYQNFGDQFKKLSDLGGVVDNVLQGAIKPQTPQQAQADRVLAMQQDAETKGLLELDTTNGKYKATPNASEIREAQSAGKISWNGTNWVDTKTNTQILDPSRIQYNDKGLLTVRNTLRY